MVLSQPNQMNFSLCVGEDRPLVVTITDASGNPIDIAGWSLAFYAHAPGAQPFIVKTTGNGGIVLTDALVGQATIYLVDADTAGAAPGNYDYSIQRTDAGFDAVLTLGNMVLLGF